MYCFLCHRFSESFGDARRLWLKTTARFSIMAAVLLLGACTTVQEQSSTETATSDQTQPVASETASAEATEPNAEPERPGIELTEDILYKFLVAEIAGQREQLDLSVAYYLDLARSTRDPLIVSRAARIAVYARDDAAAKESASLWAELDPESSDAYQILAVMAVREGDTNTALKHLDTILKSSGEEAGLNQKLWMVANLLSREKDRDQVKFILEQLMVDHQNDPEVLLAYAQVLTRLGDLAHAKNVMEQVILLAPEDDTASMTYVSILNQLGQPAEALSWLEDVLKNKDDDFNLRIFYARILTDLQRFDEARRQFEILAVQQPKNPDVLYSLGLLYLQANRLDDAKKYFVRLSETKEYIDDGSYYLGRIAEEKGDLAKAEEWYQGVSTGKNYFDAQMRIGLLLGKKGKLKIASEHFSKIQTENPRQQSILVQAEAEMLTDAKQYQEAMQIFDKALENNLDLDLLYSRAMLAEKMDRLDILEQDLRAIIAQDANNSQALNALGYTLADRTERYDEAYELIKKALEISPNDYFILDSMGWVLYRQGHLDEAIEYLEKAMALRNDPEIAAHLGEVLWVKGDKAAAQAIWDTALKETPDDVRLHKVINRLNP